MNILSIQSSVTWGHVGNAAAMLPLQLLGHEVWPIYTVQFSNHPGHGGFRGRLFPPAHVDELVEGLAERGLLGEIDAVLTGYLGAPGMGRAVLGAVRRVREANPRAIWCCDPVMGDDGRGIYVRPGVAAFFARAASAADILAPNRFELELLAATRAGSLDEVLRAARGLIGRGSRMVAVKGLGPPCVPRGRIGAALVTRERAWLAHAPELALDRPPRGSGDAFVALLLGRLLAGVLPGRALGLAVSGLHALLARAKREGAREMPLVAARQALIRPPRLYVAEPVVKRNMARA